jgi:hypothetical protein
MDHALSHVSSPFPSTKGLADNTSSAQHASFGLALQIMERQTDALFNANVTSKALMQSTQTCKKWNKWASDCNNWWFDPKTQRKGYYCDDGLDAFSPDSGI